MNMKDHSGFYDWLRFMAVVSIAVGGLLVIWLTATKALVPSVSDNLPSSFWASPAQRIMTGVMVLVSGLSGIAFGVCDFMCRLKAVGVFAIIKAVSLVGLGLFLHNPLILILAIGYCICGVYALKCHREEKNFNKSITAQ